MLKVRVPDRETHSPVKTWPKKKKKKKDKVQVPQWNEMLSIYSIIVSFMSLKFDKAILFCFYILVEVN